MLGPLYWVISWVLLRWHALWHAVVGGGQPLATNWDWVLAIIFLVITLRAILFPVYVKQIKSQRAMQALAPQMKALQEKYKGDRQTLQQETMKLYREAGTNPLMGCLPMLIQAPVMWALFHVLRHLKPTMPDRLKMLYGWTVDQFDQASHAKLFGAPIAASFRSNAQQLASMDASGNTVKVVAGVLVVIMIVTTYMTSRQMILKTGWAEDPTQKMMQRLMLYGIPASLLISGFAFPIGVVLYWTTTNLFSLGQQFWVLHKYPPPNLSKSGASASSRTPVGAKAASDRGGASRGGGLFGGRSSGGLGRGSGGAKGAGNAAPPVDGRALAPRPGAKPINPKKGGARQAGPAPQSPQAGGATPADRGGQSAGAGARGAGKGGPAKDSGPTKADDAGGNRDGSNGAGSAGAGAGRGGAKKGTGAKRPAAGRQGAREQGAAKRTSG